MLSLIVGGALWVCGERKTYTGSCWLALGGSGCVLSPQEPVMGHAGLALRSSSGQMGGRSPAMLTRPTCCFSFPRRNQAMRKKLILYFKRRNHARKQWVSPPAAPALEARPRPCGPGLRARDPPGPLGSAAVSFLSVEAAKKSQGQRDGREERAVAQ